MKKIPKLFLCFFYLGFMSAQSQTRNTLEFDAADAASLVNCGTSTSYSPTIFTAEAWVNIYTGGGTIMSNVDYINGAGEGAKGFSIRLNGQKVEFVMGKGIDAGDWNVISATNDLNLNTWTHVAVVFDGTTAKVFYNGVLQGSLSTTDPILVSAKKFYLGEHPTYSNRRITGQLSDVRIWNVARTSGQIQASMNSFLLGTETGLVANWKLDEGSGITVNEQVNNTSASLGEGTTWQLNTSLNINDMELGKSFNIYPNPSKGIYKIKSSINETIDYKIYTITGKLVKSGIVSKTFNYIDLSNKSKGIYLLVGTLQRSHFIKKLVVN